MEACLIEKGYEKGVFSRNVFTKALFDLKGAYWMLVEETNVQICPQVLRDSIQIWNRENIDVALQDVSTNKIIKIYVNFQEKVCLGTPMNSQERQQDPVPRLFITSNWSFMLIFTVKSNKEKLFHKCNGEVANLFSAYNGQNYSRWVFWSSDIWVEKCK